MNNSEKITWPVFMISKTLGQTAIKITGPDAYILVRAMKMDITNDFEYCTKKSATTEISGLLTSEAWNRTDEATFNKLRAGFLDGVETIRRKVNGQ